MNALGIDNPNGEFVTFKQAAENCNLSVDMVKKLAREGGCVLKIGDRIQRVDAQKFYSYLREKYAAATTETADD